ncbi:hypothetical protein FB45DRAFT_1008140 [Roridomyces roridus]|uniref:Uncharacterized protein n=1 Tax=Roridomyces roridus TaxID=1738132 RepID=A0AAD7BBJ5_9AGAR|nr:hypothetical protein FB45DRAFT_1008140 [Roridomyces roridus]
MAPKFLPATFIALLSMASAAVASPAAPIAQLVINTPVNGVAQCEPVLITWSGGILHQRPTSSLYKPTHFNPRPSSISASSPERASLGSSTPRWALPCSSK